MFKVRQFFATVSLCAALAPAAVKVHQLNRAWSEARKASYVRHAVREYSIHKALRHPNVVRLLDIFEVDANTFATVLELCPGGDLDSHLKEHAVRAGGGGGGRVGEGREGMRKEEGWCGRGEGSRPPSR